MNSKSNTHSTLINIKFCAKNSLICRSKKTYIVVGVVFAGVFLALIVVCTVLFIYRRRVRALKYLEPITDFEMHLEAKPNLAQLRLILETQLKKGQILGYGAFGTVFRVSVLHIAQNAAVPG